MKTENRNYYPFTSAKPVWAEGEETKKNVTLGLYANVEKSYKTIILKIATSGFYRIFINGEFTYYGPARCAKDFYRVDEIVIPAGGKGLHVAIEAVNYYVGSFNSVRQPGFIQAELVADEKIVAATGVRGFSSVRLTDRVRRLQRYSYQRPFAEGYRLCRDVYQWRLGKNGENTEPVEMRVTSEKLLVQRNLSPSRFPKTVVKMIEAKGTVACHIKPKSYIKDRSLVNVKEPPERTPEGFPEAELEWHLTDEIQEIINTSFQKTELSYNGITRLKSAQFEILSFECEKSGFLTLDISCKESGTIYLFFDEILREGDVNPLRMYCCNAIRLDAKEGDYHFQSMEPYGMRYVKIVCESGSFEMKQIGMTEVVCSEPISKTYQGTDAELNRIYDAALETFRQNSCDIFMDCPTRERAGWLCDSYFMAKAERYFTGENVIERNYLENYLLPEKFSDIPEGMVPMCYPADSWTGNFIPNWAMWLVIELADYQVRTGDMGFIQAFRERVYGILNWFLQYENDDGLLEKLPGWVFVEWSMSNEFVKDINFPSNMLYAYMLEKTGELYQDQECLVKAERLKELIRKRSYLGQFFCDNEVLKEGKTELSGKCTETCQYYAFFTGVATPKQYPELWNTLIESFGPHREEKELYPDVYPSNAFIGNFLRLMLLQRYGVYGQLLEEIKGYFLYMADKTGTLWEKKNELESCNHGFASYVAVLIEEAEERKGGSR